MRCSRSVLLALIPMLAVAAQDQTGDTIQTSFGGHPLTITLPSATPGVTKSVRALDARLQGDIAISSADPAAVAAAYGLQIVSRSGATAVLAPQIGQDATAALRSLAALAQDPRVQWSEPVLFQQHRTRVVPSDPRYSQQWQLGTGAMNLESVWDSYTGSGVRIGIVDSGVKVTHEDLAANCVAGWDLLSNDSDPTPSNHAETDHGTGTAGTAAAAKNSHGGVGVAFGASIVPLRLIDDGQTTSETADALAWGLSGHVPSGSGATEVDVSNNSWGPADDGVDGGAAAENPSSSELTALDLATTNGRGGKGTIFVWAAGNGGDNDTCDRDGYASNRHVIAVGSTNFGRNRSDYSERGASLFISAPVGNSADTGDSRDDGVVIPDYTSLTTGVGDTYTKGIGTSFAAPLVAGVVALMLQANPALTWRDVRHILAATAAKDLPSDPNWITNGAGLHWNLNYGFGEVDGAAAVAAAASWTNVPAAAAPLTASASPMVAIPDPGVTGAVSLPISADAHFRAEWVELTVDCQHPYQGDLAFTLTSPRGTVVNFLARPLDTSAARVWTLTSVATWDEWPDGTWTVTAHDVAAGDSGTLRTVGLKIYGYLATSTGAPGTSAAVGSSSVITAGGTKAGSGGSTSGGTTSGSTTGGMTSDAGGGGCGLGGGSLACFGLLSALLLRRRQR